MEFRPSRTTWSPRQVKFALKFAYGRTIKEAAQLAGISRVTAHKWLADPHYRHYVDSLRDAIMENVVSLYVKRLAKSVGVHAALMDSEDENVRMRAAQLIQEGALRYMSASVLNRRLSAMESRYLEKGDERPVADREAGEGGEGGEGNGYADALRSGLRP